MKRKVVVVVLMLACGLGGYIGGYWVKSRQAEHELAVKTYRAFAEEGLPAGIPAERDLWKRQLSDRLTQNLALPWSAHLNNDAAWGTAYMILRDSGYSSWKCVEGVPSERQDEMIRYLCFLIERCSGTKWGISNGHGEFAALLTYPQEALKRNRDKIQRAVLKAASCDFDQVRVVAASYAVHVSGSDWGKELCWLCLQCTAFPASVDPFDFMMDGLYSQAKGDYAITENSLGLHEKPAADAQSGASAVLARFVEAKWDSGARGPAIRAWREKLATPASRPATKN
jgi:hypothetical protein